MSSVPKNKEELENAIQTAFDKLNGDLSSIPCELSRKMEITGNIKGTLISVSDLLAYLIGWGRLVLKWYELKSNDQDVDFPETGYKWNELGRLAQSFHFQYQTWSYEELLEEFKLVTSDIMRLVGSLDDQKLYGETWYKKYTLGKMIQFNTSSPMLNMRGRVRKFKKANLIK